MISERALDHCRIFWARYRVDKRIAEWQNWQQTEAWETARSLVKGGLRFLVCIPCRHLLAASHRFLAWSGRAGIKDNQRQLAVRFWRVYPALWNTRLETAIQAPEGKIPGGQFPLHRGHGIGAVRFRLGRCRELR